MLAGKTGLPAQRVGEVNSQADLIMDLPLDPQRKTDSGMVKPPFTDALCPAMNAHSSGPPLCDVDPICNPDGRLTEPPDA